MHLSLPSNPIRTRLRNAFADLFRFSVFYLNPISKLKFIVLHNLSRRKFKRSLELYSAPDCRETFILFPNGRSIQYRMDNLKRRYFILISDVINRKIVARKKNPRVSTETRERRSASLSLILLPSSARPFPRDILYMHTTSRSNL